MRAETVVEMENVFCTYCALWRRRVRSAAADSETVSPACASPTGTWCE